MEQEEEEDEAEQKGEQTSETIAGEEGEGWIAGVPDAIGLAGWPHGLDAKGGNGLIGLGELEKGVLKDNEIEIEADKPDGFLRSGGHRIKIAFFECVGGGMIVIFW